MHGIDYDGENRCDRSRSGEEAHIQQNLCKGDAVKEVYSKLQSGANQKPQITLFNNDINREHGNTINSDTRVNE